MSPFLQRNVGKNPTLQIVYIEPYEETVEQLQREVREYLSKIDSQIEVVPNVVQYQSTESTEKVEVVNYIVMQVLVLERGF